MSNQSTNYYNVLKVAQNATKDEIRTRYRELAREYHPDNNPGDMISEEKMKDINVAYGVLSNEKKRDKYDWDMRQNTTDIPHYKNETRTETRPHRKAKAESATPMPEYQRETKSDFRHVSSEWTEMFSDFSYFGNADSKVTDWVNEKIKAGEIKLPDFKNEPQEKGFVYSFGKLELSNPEFDLLAGLTMAFGKDRPTEIVCGKYKVILGEDLNDFKIMVQAGRFAPEGAKIQKQVDDGVIFDEISRETWVDVGQVDPMRMVGITVPVDYQELLKGVVNLATDVAGGRMVDGNDIWRLNELSHISFSGEDNDKRVGIEATMLKNEVNQKIAEWKVAGEGGIRVGKESVFAKRESVRRV